MAGYMGEHILAPGGGAVPALPDGTQSCLELLCPSTQII